MKIDVSIIIPVKNGIEGAIDKCLEGIFSQQTGYNFEVIVIDSGSSDGTLNLLKSYGNKIRLIEIKPDEFRHGRTRNLGASYASGEFLIFINQDAWPYNSKWLNPLIEDLKEVKDSAGVFSRHFPKPNAYLNDAISIIRGMPSKKIIKRKQINLSAKDFFFSTVSAAIKREVFLKYPFNENILICEDLEWAKRVLADGYSIIYEPESIVFHSHTSDFKSSYILSRKYKSAWNHLLNYSRIFHSILFDLIKSCAKTIIFFIKNCISIVYYFYSTEMSSRRLSDEILYFIRGLFAGFLGELSGILKPEIIILSIKRITFVLPGYCLRPVGGARVVYIYANELVKRGYEVSVIHPRFMKNRQKGLMKTIFARFSSIYKLFSRPKITWQNIDPKVNMLYVPEAIEKYVPDSDVVFATSWETAEYVMKYSSPKGKKYYLIQHYEIDAQGKNKQRVDATWQYPFKKAVIAKWLYKIGLDLGISENMMKHVPNGIDINTFKLINPIESRKRLVGMMYHKADWKGSKDGVRALEIVRERFGDIKIIFFGKDAKPIWLPSWITYYSNPKQQFLVQNIYNELSIFISPSWREGSPLPPSEAMACGAALVSTNCTGIDEYALHNETALLSPIKDPEALADNIMKLLSDDELRINIARKGNISIKERTWQKCTDLLEGFIING